MIDDGAVIICAVDMLGTCANTVVASSLSVREQHIVFEPNTTIEIDDPEIENKLLKFLDALDDNDDVQSVFHNAELRDDE